MHGLRKELDDIIAALRFLINGLTQPRFEIHPLSSLVDGLVSSLSAMHHVRILLKPNYPEKEFYIPPDIKQELYYLIHETAHNFLKNSMGFQLIITLTWTDELLISMKDNGQGLQRGRGYGMGMISMKERADRIQATISFNSVMDGLDVQIRLKNNFSQ